jgi:hypothetical protein
MAKNEIRQAYNKICAEAKSAGKWFVSLYAIESYYGGPEEGGWWGNDCVLVEYQEVRTEEEADLLAEKITQLAAQMTEDAKRQHGERCLRESEWCAARGLDDDFLPEVDGHDEYRVVIEETPGSQEHRGSRHYE